MNNIYKYLYVNSNVFRLYNITSRKLASIIQIGGGKKLTIEHKSNIYKYEQGDIDDNLYILTSNKGIDCITVIFSKDINIAEIHNITGDSSCLPHRTNKKVGSVLLYITIKLLKKYKNKFNIKIITVQDNSIKKCKNETIFLSKMLILLTGHTWYGKYGFKPMDIYNTSIDKIKNKKYEDNITIMNNITIEQANILQYIEKTNNPKLIKATKITLDKTPNMLLKDFLSNLMSDFDKLCLYFSQFYEDLFNGITYNDMKLTDFHAQLFGLFI